MTYDPRRHNPNSPRLVGYDYTRLGAYFVTICTHKRWCLFGEIQNGMMHLNECGQAVAEEWQRTDELRDHVQLRASVVMPNHVHGIVVIVPDGFGPVDLHGYDLIVETQRAASLQRQEKAEKA